MVKRIGAAALLAGVALLAGCNKSDGGSLKPGAPVAAVPAPAGSDWTQQVAATPEGGFRMGNPNAAVKLVEYGALTCSHCAHFSETGSEALKTDFVKTGRVSWEFRPFLLNGADVAPSLLASCQGPGPFFKLAEQFYANQAKILEPLATMDEAERTRIGALPPEQQFKAVAQAMNLDSFFRQRGVPQAKIDACLSDRAAADKLAERTRTASEKDGVTGTPAFLINGELQQNAADWESLKPRLNEAVGA